MTFGTVARTETQMVHLDHGLITRARSLITGANVHRVKELIFAYEHAVRLHNEKSSGHMVYQEKYEKELRRFIERESQKRAAFMN
jgi:hypothetical protein